jgi:hypothetical protein
MRIIKKKCACKLPNNSFVRWTQHNTCRKKNNNNNKRRMFGGGLLSNASFDGAPGVFVVCSLYQTHVFLFDLHHGASKTNILIFDKVLFEIIIAITTVDE